jgi:hypothetical protein
MALLALLCIAMSLLMVPSLRAAVLETARNALYQGVEGYKDAIISPLLGSGS